MEWTERGGDGGAGARVAPPHDTAAATDTDADTDTDTDTGTGTITGIMTLTMEGMFSLALMGEERLGVEERK